MVSGSLAGDVILTDFGETSYTFTIGGTVDDDLAADNLFDQGGADWLFDFPPDLLSHVTAADRVAS